MSTRGPDPEVTDETLLRSIRNGERPFATVTTVTETISLGRERVRQRLNRLSSEGKLNREQVSGSVVLYWLDDPFLPDK